MIYLLIISILITPILTNINFYFVSFSIFPLLLSILLLYKKCSGKGLFTYSIIAGILFDIFYSDIKLNFIIYPILTILILIIFNNIKYKLNTLLITSMFIIFIYLNITFLIYKIFNMQTVAYSYFLSKLIFIYIFNALYVCIVYIILNINTKAKMNI